LSESTFSIDEKDVHAHLKARMSDRGITIEEINTALKRGWPADDAKSGTYGKVWVFSYEKEWLGRKFAEKEVTVYYKVMDEEVVILTAKARYGDRFSRKEGSYEI
jgi:hypothetical protein